MSPLMPKYFLIDPAAQRSIVPSRFSRERLRMPRPPENPLPVVRLPSFG